MRVRAITADRAAPPPRARRRARVHPQLQLPGPASPNGPTRTGPRQPGGSATARAMSSWAG